ncbi:hypothetical protein VPHD85_0069 [Vibrio phage D85]|nr:hypothetical protein NVP1205O_60 [Vibrio phage 1.205.O._10N.222.51.A7]QZI91355.1 hypothetical protein PODOV033v1_p0048 [Vibrio phage 252E42.2]
MKITWLELKKLSVRASLKKAGIAIVGRKKAGCKNNDYVQEALIIDINKAKKLAKNNPAIAKALSK